MYPVLNRLFGQKEGLSRMTGNLSRTVLRGAGARESTCLPDLTKSLYRIYYKNEKRAIISSFLILT
jgi:hypothetical protein